MKSTIVATRRSMKKVKRRNTSIWLYRVSSCSPSACQSRQTMKCNSKSLSALTKRLWRTTQKLTIWESSIHLSGISALKVQTRLIPCLAKKVSRPSKKQRCMGRSNLFQFQRDSSWAKMKSSVNVRGSRQPLALHLKAPFTGLKPLNSSEESKELMKPRLKSASSCFWNSSKFRPDLKW